MKLKITVHGVAYEVDVEVLDASDEMQQQASPLPTVGAGPARASQAAAAPPPPLARASQPAAGANVGGVVSPIAGTVLEVKCKAGDQVQQGQDLLVIEAMKMETSIAAPSAGAIQKVLVAAGDSVRESQMLVEMQ